MVADETYNTGDTDFRAQILKIKSTKPDVIYVSPQTPVSGELILKQMKENGVTTQIVVNDAMASGEQARNELYNGIYFWTRVISC